MGGFERRLDDAGQVVADGVQVDGILEPGQRGHRGLGAIAGPVEPPVHRSLHPPPDRVEQGRCGQRGGGDRDWCMEVKYLNS